LRAQVRPADALELDKICARQRSLALEEKGLLRASECSFGISGIFLIDRVVEFNAGGLGLQIEPPQDDLSVQRPLPSRVRVGSRGT
jgi:hypothetical protein